MNYVGQRQLMAILLTDVVNFSDQAAKNEEQTLRQLEEDFSLIRRLCRERGGEVLKSTGDGLLVSFLCSEKAIEAAEEAQRALLQPGSHLRHRIGIHAGDVFRQEKDVLGDGVNLAARLTEIAESGGICVSETVHQSTRSRHSGFDIRPVWGRIRNAPPDFRAHHLRLACHRTFYQPTVTEKVCYLTIFLLGFSFLVSPTLVGFETLSQGTFQTEPFFLAGLSVAQYPAGIFLGFAFGRNHGSRPRREILRRMALWFSVYAGVAGGLLSVLGASQTSPRVTEFWPWLFFLQATAAVICLGIIAGRFRAKAPLVALLLGFAASPVMAELGPSLDDFCGTWGAPIKRGKDELGGWQDFKRSREWARVWTDQKKIVLQIQYRLPDYAACWTVSRLGQKAQVSIPHDSPHKVGLWERDYAPPFRSATPRFSTEYWAQRDPVQNDFSAYAVVADEMTSIWMLPPFVILVPFIIDLGRPITLTIRSRDARPLFPRSSEASIAGTRRNFHH